MANEHIARLQKIGFAPEVTAGTEVAPTFYMPKAKGILTTKFEQKYDEAAYGNIDKNREAYTTRKWSELEISDTQPRSVWIGHFLSAWFGQPSYPCVKFTTSSITGTFVEGETVTESTSTATGTLRRLDDGGSAKALYIVPVSGTFTGGQTLTGGTSGATCTGTMPMGPSAGRYHVFRRLNSNNHRSYTISANDPVSGDQSATYCMLDTIDFESKADDLVAFAMKWMGLPMAAAGGSLTPTYTSEAPFIGRDCSVKLATAFTGLDAASATPMERTKFSGTKGLEVVHQFGGTSPTSFHNTEFEVKGDFTALFASTTLRDAALAGTAYAIRQTIANTSASALATGVYPTLQFDVPEVYFNDWGKDSENTKVVRQNLAWTAVYNVARGLTIEALLISSRTTAY
jgi:hypothetical protein